MASWRNGYTRLSSKQEVPGSNPTVGKNFSFVIFACFAYRKARQ